MALWQKKLKDESLYENVIRVTAVKRTVLIRIKFM